MKHDKDYYRGLQVPKGFVWGGYDFDKQMHMFARKVLQRWEPIGGGVSKLVQDQENGTWHGYWENILVTEDDIEDGSFLVFFEKGWTRT